MAKLVTSDVTNFQNEQTAAGTINSNSAATELAMENTLSRDGTSPNQMLAQLDMNSKRIINLPAPQASGDPLRFGDISLAGIAMYTAGTGITINGLVISTSGGSISGDDSLFDIFNHTDNTKIAAFSAAGITTGTTRTFTFPDATTTLVGTDTTQTLTNKTIAVSQLSGQVTVAKGGTGIASGTSGGIPYYSSTSTIASSGAFNNGAIMAGGGAGGAPKSAGWIFNAALDIVQCTSANSTAPNIQFGNTTNDGFGPFFVMSKTRAGAVCTPGDFIFGFAGQSLNTGLVLHTVAELGLIVDGSPTATTVPTRWDFLTTNGAGTDIAQRMSFDSAGNLYINNSGGALGNATFPGFINTGGYSRVTSDFTATSTTTFANVTGLTCTVGAGLTYGFQATLFTTSNTASGVKAAISGTATATSIIYEGYCMAANAFTGQTRAASLTTAVAAVTAQSVAKIMIEGTITVNAGGTLTVQFAQNVSGGTASTVLRGSWFKVWAIT